MRTVVREKLRKYLSEHGKDILQQPEALRLYLLREEGRFQQEIDGLLRLVEEGHLPPFPKEGERQAFLQKVVQEIGVSPEDAEWLLDSWEEAWSLVENPEENSREDAASHLEEHPSQNASKPLSSFQMFLANPAAFTPQAPSSPETFLRTPASSTEDARPIVVQPEKGTPPSSWKDIQHDAPQEEVHAEMRQMLGSAPFSAEPSAEKAPSSGIEEDAVFEISPPSDPSGRDEERERPSSEETLSQETWETEPPDVKQPPAEDAQFSEEASPPEQNPQEEAPLFGIAPGGASTDEDLPRKEAFTGEPALFEEDLSEKSLQREEESEILKRDGSLENVSAEDARDLFWKEDLAADYVGVQETEVLLEDSLMRKRRFRLAVAGLCGILAAVSVGYSMWRNTPERLLDRGRSRFEKKDYTAAALLFQKALHKDAENPEGYQLLGESLYKQEKYREALGAYEESLTRISPDAFLYSNIAYAQLGLGNLDEASATFKEALEMVPLYSQARKGLALTYFQQGERDRAVEELQKALESIPEDAEMLLVLGKIHAESGNLDAGEILFSRVLDVDPDNESARLAVEDLARERSLRQAQEAARAARLLEYLEEGEALLLSGEIPEAEALYRKALEEVPESLEARGGLLDALLMQHRSEDARLLVSETQSLEKTDENAPDFVRYLVQTLDSYERALQERVARHKAYDVAIARASEMREKRQFEGALAAYRGILEEEEYPPAYIGLGRTLAKRGDYPQALEAYDRGVVLISSSGGGDIPEDIVREMEDLRKAIARQELAKEMEPLYSKARLLESQGKTEEARKLYESILQRDPNHRNARNRLAYLSQKPRQVPSSKPESSAQEPSPEAPPGWLLLPDGKPALLEMHRQEELRNLRKSAPSEAQESSSSLSEKAPGERVVLAERPCGRSLG